ncbi:unnamed protein product [Ectocarpus fasciculatus]
MLRGICTRSQLRGLPLRGCSANACRTTTGPLGGSRGSALKLQQRWESSVPDVPKAATAAIPYSEMSVGVPKEITPLEKRVAQTPDTVAKLVKLGITVNVEAGAGEASKCSDKGYEAAGANIVGKDKVWKSDLVMKVNPPTPEEAALLESRAIMSLFWPAQNKELLEQMAKQGATVLAMDQLPRTLSRGQSFDVLSSQANIAGYRAVLEAAHHFDRFFAGQTTAAGRIPPAKVLVLGGGVAGLAAVQAAKNMGAVVKAFDVRPAVKEQIESLGGEFLEVDLQEDGSGAGGYAKEMSKEWFEAAERMLAAEMKGIDVVIGTALIPGRAAPRLITEPMVHSMKVGSVTVDLAAATGGNIATTKADEVYKTPNGVTCIGYTDMTSRLANTASTLFSNNVVKLFSSAGPFSTGDKEKFQIDYKDEAVRGVLAVDAGTVTWPAPQKPPPPPPAKKDEVEEVEAVPIDIEAMYKKSAMRTTATSATVLGLGMISPNLAFSNMMTTFALSGIVGYQASREVVKGVSHSLHSPLMAVTNAISGLTALGGMYLMGPGLVPHTTAELLGAGAVLISTVNISGGFLVTKKMLDMFKRPDDPPEYYQMYLLPAGTLLGGYAVTKAAGYQQMDHLVSMASAVCCIGGIGGLSSQSTARLGNVLGMSGVAFGVAATVGTLAPGPAQLAQLAGLMGVGGVGGYQVREVLHH